MTREEAGDLTLILIRAYPTQKRDAFFLSLLADALVKSHLDPFRVAGRLAEWTRTEKFWPSIAEVVEPFDDAPTPLKQLPPPDDAVPSAEGLAIFRQMTIERDHQ